MVFHDRFPVAVFYRRLYPIRSDLVHKPVGCVTVGNALDLVEDPTRQAVLDEAFGEGLVRDVDADRGVARTTPQVVDDVDREREADVVKKGDSFKAF